MNFMRNIWNLLIELLEKMGKTQKELHEFRIDFMQKHGYDPIPDHIRDIFH